MTPIGYDEIFFTSKISSKTWDPRSNVSHFVIPKLLDWIFTLSDNTTLIALAWVTNTLQLFPWMFLWWYLDLICSWLIASYFIQMRWWIILYLILSSVIDLILNKTTIRQVIIFIFTFMVLRLRYMNPCVINFKI